MQYFKINTISRILLFCVIITSFMCSFEHKSENEIRNLKNQVSNLIDENEKLQNQVEDYKLQLQKYESEVSVSSNIRNSQTIPPEINSEWQLVESTNLQAENGDNVISGTISEGYIFKSLSGNFYRAKPLTLEVVVAVMPNAKIYSNGLEYKLIIEDFDEPVFCDKMNRR